MPPAMPEGASSRKRNNAGDSMGRGRQPAAPRSSQPTLPPANLTQQQQHNLTQANLLAPHFASLAARGALDLHMRGAPLDAHMRSAMGATMGAGAMGALGGLPPHMRTTPLPGFGGLAPGMAPIQSMNAALAHMGWPPMPLPYPPALMATMAHDGMGCPTGLPTASLSTAGLPTAHPSASLNPAGLAHPVSTAHVGIGGIGGGGMGSGGTGGGRMNGGGLGGGGSMGVGGGMGGSVVSGHGMSGGGVDGGDGGGSMGGGGMSGSGNMSGGESSGHVSDGPLDESSGEEVMQLEGILEFLENWEQFERPSRDVRVCLHVPCTHARDTCAFATCMWAEAAVCLPTLTENPNHRAPLAALLIQPSALTPRASGRDVFSRQLCGLGSRCGLRGRDGSGGEEERWQRAGGARGGARQHGRWR